MRLEIDLDAERYFVGEDFPVAIRIVNPNKYDVYLRGFEFGALEPHLEIAYAGGIIFPDQKGEFLDISLGGTISAMGGPPVCVPSQGHLEHRRLVYSGTKLDMAHWLLLSAGDYRLRLNSYVGVVTPSEPQRRTKVHWTSEVVGFTLTMPVRRDLAALEFLRHQTAELSEHQRSPECGFSSIRFQLGMCSQFLERFSDSAYAAEVRWRLAKLLPGEIFDQWSPLHDNPEMVELWDECLTFCLDKGGAYAEEFLSWNMDIGGNLALNRAREHKRGDLVKRIVEELNRKYPKDEEAALYRRVIAVAETESLEKARKVAASLAERFPKGTYSLKADELLKGLEAKSGSN